MTDAEYEATKARIDAMLDRWIPLLGLVDWHIYREYRRQDSDDLRRMDGNTEVARCHVIWEYEEIGMSWWLPLIFEEEWTDERLEPVVVHELMHIVVREMREDAKRKGILHEERVSTRLARAFVRTRQAAMCSQPHIGDGAVSEAV